MHFVVRRAALCAVAAATVKLAAKGKTHNSLKEHLKLQMQFENGLLRVHAADGVVTFDAWLPAVFADTGGAICTNAKEFAHLLRSATATELSCITGDGTASNTACIAGKRFEQYGVVRAEYGEFPSEFPLWDAEKLALPPPGGVLATLQFPLLKRAISIVADSCSNLAAWYVHDTVLLETLPSVFEGASAGVRFCATDGTRLVLLDARSGVLVTRDSSEAYTFNTVALLNAALELWEDPVDPQAVDCEIQIVERSIQHDDGSAGVLDPFVVFDVSGGGYRIRVSTGSHNAFPNYRSVLSSPEAPGLLFEPDPAALLNAAVLAEQAVLRGGYGRVGFRCFFADHATTHVQLFYAYKTKLDNSQLVAQLLPEDYPGVLLGGLRVPNDITAPVPYVSEVVAFDSVQIEAVLRQLQNCSIVVKLTGVATEMEITTIGSGVDPITFVVMPCVDDVLRSRFGENT